MDRWQKQQKEDELGCSDSDAYVRSAMGGRDCAAVAETGECESIRALGEPNLVCSCSCLPVRLSLRFRSLLLSRVVLTFSRAGGPRHYAAGIDPRWDRLRHARSKDAC